MKRDAAIQFENEKFQRLYSGVTLSIIDETEQALLYKEGAGTEENPEEILVLESVRVTAFATENGLQVHGYIPDAKGRFKRGTLIFRPYL